MARIRPNRRSGTIPESVTLAIAARAGEMAREGLDVVSLGAGEPDFGTMAATAEAGIQAIRKGQTRYTAAAGSPELRQAGSQWLRREFGLEYGPDEVMATAGAKPAIHMALMTLLEPDDVVLLPTPHWVSYPSLIAVAGGQPIDLPPVPTQGHVHSGEQIAATARQYGAKGIVINFPNNPSGAVPSRQQIEEIVQAATETQMWILSDEIYATILFDGAEHISPGAVAGGKDRVLVVNGGSKSHSLTGWRIGFLAGPKDIIAGATKIQSQVLGNPSSVSQAASLDACLGDHSAEMARRVEAFDERRRYLLAAINQIPDLSLAAPKGAFYVLVDARALCQRLGIDDVELANRLLQDALLAVVPGSAFAIPGFIRLSFAASMQQLEKATERLGRFVQRSGRS